MSADQATENDEQSCRCADLQFVTDEPASDQDAVPKSETGSAVEQSRIGQMTTFSSGRFGQRRHGR